MADINNPFLEENPFITTKHRFYSLFQPIQKTKTKTSDFVNYLRSPLVDCFLLPSLALDLTVNITSIIASLLKACYEWDRGNQRAINLRYSRYSSHRHFHLAQNELEAAYSQFARAVGDICAILFNVVFSTLSLVTRPVASLVHAIFGDHTATLDNPTEVVLSESWGDTGGTGVDAIDSIIYSYDPQAASVGPQAYGARGAASWAGMDSRRPVYSWASATRNGQDFCRGQQPTVYERTTTSGEATRPHGDEAHDWDNDDSSVSSSRI